MTLLTRSRYIVLAQNWGLQLNGVVIFFGLREGSSGAMLMDKGLYEMYHVTCMHSHRAPLLQRDFACHGANFSEIPVLILSSCVFGKVG